MGEREIKKERQRGRERERERETVREREKGKTGIRNDREKKELKG